MGVRRAVFPTHAQKNAHEWATQSFGLLAPADAESFPLAVEVVRVYWSKFST